MSEREIAVAVVGGGFIGQMHSLALQLVQSSKTAPVRPRLDMIVDLDAARAAEIARQFGYRRYDTDWRRAVEGTPTLFINATPNSTHFEPTLAAAEAGHAVLCEKPLASSADEAFELWRRVARRGVVHRCSYMHRFIPAIRSARQLIVDGQLGEIRAFRSRFLLDMGATDTSTWRFDRRLAGSGALGDLGSHHVDLVHYLVGDVDSVTALSSTWSRTASGEPTNDDAFACVARLASGGTATLEASRVAAGHALTGVIEVDGTLGSVRFSMERLNELTFSRRGSHTTRLVTAPDDPLSDFWLPVGLQGSHPIGWQECFAFQTAEALAASAGLATESGAATFEDGYRVAEVVAAIERSTHSSTRQEVPYRSDEQHPG